MNTGLAGPFGTRLADTAICYAAYAGTPEQQADPYNGDVQLTNWFTSACVLSLPTSKRSLPSARPQKGLLGLIQEHGEL